MSEEFIEICKYIISGAMLLLIIGLVIAALIFIFKELLNNDY